MNKTLQHTKHNLREMLQALKDEARPRKFRLYACACLRQLFARTNDPQFRRTVVMAERFIEGDRDREGFRAAFRRAWPDGWERARVAALTAIDPLQRDMYYWRCLELADEVVDVLRGVTHLSWKPAPPRDSEESRTEQVALLDDVFGDSFTKVSFNPRWRTREVEDLAESLAAEHALEALPVLADALEDGGCEDRAILNHLRSPGPHALGCWALDLVRGKR